MSKITKFFDIYGMKCHSCELSVEHEIIYILHFMLPIRRDFPGCHLCLERSGRKRDLWRFQQLDGGRRAERLLPAAQHQ